MRRRLRVLFCALSTPGFLFPQLGLAGKLRDIGHDCAFVTGLDMEHFVKNEGFVRLPRSKKDGHSFEVGEWGSPLHIAMQVKHIQYALGIFPADILVTNALGLGAMLVSRIQEIPVCVIGIASYLFPTKIVTSDTAMSDLKNRNLREMLDIFNRACESLGLPRTTGDPDPNVLLGDCFLLRSVPEFTPYAEFLPEKVQYAGALMWEPAGILDEQLRCALEHARAVRRPIVYLQPSRAIKGRGAWPNVVRALARKNITVVACTGRLNEPFESVPENFIVRDYVPQMRILPFCAGVITTGHSTPVLGALIAGVPLLVIPDYSGTHDTADMCRLTAAAIAGDKSKMSVDSDYTEGLVHTLLQDNALLQAARRAKESFQRVDSLEVASAAVLSLRFPVERH